MKLVEGKLPVEEDGFVVNRAALRALGYTSLEGATVLDLRMKEFVPDLPARPIVGVIEDYYSGHISKGVRPMLFMVSPTMRGDVYQIACQPGKLSQVIDYLRKLEREVYGTENFQYSLLKDDVQKLYKSDQQVATITRLLPLLPLSFPVWACWVFPCSTSASVTGRLPSAR